MRLTNIDRDAFVRAVLDDVPTEDYQERFRALVLAEAARLLPPKVAELYKDKKYAPWLRADVRITGVLGYVSAVGLSETSATVGENLRRQHEELTALHKKQASALEALRAKLWAIIAGCSTLKQAQERLPEFAKYLPTDRDGAGAANLPAVSGVVADLVKAGWPKGGRK